MNDFQTTFDPILGVTNELTNSGKLYIIKNANLRNKISAFTNILGEVREEEMVIFNHTEQRNIPFISEHYQIGSVTAEYFGKSCSSKKCTRIVTPQLLSNCNCIEEAWSPYYIEDTVFQKLIIVSPKCCVVMWDKICQDRYDNISKGGIGLMGIINMSETDYPILFEYEEKPLFYRLLKLKKYRKEYLTIFLNLLEDFYNSEHLFPIIGRNVSLIKNSIKEETFYLYPKDIFAKDLHDGIRVPDHDPSGANIKGIKQFIKDRENQLIFELRKLYYHHNPKLAILGPLSMRDQRINVSVYPGICISNSIIS